MSQQDKKKEQRKKRESILEQQILAIMQKSLKAAMDQALDELFKDWNK